MAHIPAVLDAKPMSLHRALVRLLIGLITPLALGSAGLAGAVDAVNDVTGRALVQLQAIAALPEMDRRDLPEIHRFAQNVVSDNAGTLVLLIAPDGQMLVDTAVPFGSHLAKFPMAGEQPTAVDGQGVVVPTGPPPLPQGVFRDGQVAYSNVFLGKNAPGSRVSISVPVSRQGKVLYALRLSYPANDLSRVLRSAALPPHARAVLLDRSGTVFASNGVSPHAIGEKLPLPPLGTALHQGHEQDGTAVAVTHARTHSGYTVLVSVPTALAYATARKAALGWALFATATLLLSVLGAARLNRKVAQPLQRLAEGALTNQPPAATESSNIHEIDLLAGALRAAAKNERERQQEHTERIGAEKRKEAVEASEAQIRRIFAGIYVSVAVLDTDGRLVEVNHLPVERSEIGRSDVLGQLFWECDCWSYDPAVQRTVRESVAQAYREGEPIRYNVPLQVDVGRLMMVDFQLSPLRDEHGAITGLIACTVDVQDRVDAIRNLQAREAQARELARKLDEQRWLLDAALEATPAGILVSDAEGSLLRFNRGYRILWGGDPPANATNVCAMQKGWWPPGHEREGKPVELAEWPMSRALQSARIESDVIEIEPIDARGVRKTLQITAAPVPDGNGKLVGTVAVNLDITAQVRAEAALREADRHKDDFMATLGHELRNPLGPIRSAVQILRKYPTKEPGQIRAEDVIERQTKHMTHLVDDLLDMARITKGSLRMEQDTVDLRDVAAASIDAVAPVLEAKGLHFVQDLEPSALYVKGDATRLSQALINLLTNACKFTQAGGQVTLRVRRADLAAVIEVADDGIGLAPESLERIFGLYAQEGPSGGAANNGLGIGLALSRKLMVMHGGELRAASAGLGKGSTFTARLPRVAKPLEQAPTASIRTRGERRSARQRVLVVDDNNDAAELLKELLQISGFDVDTANSGATALAAAQKTFHNAFVLDIGLPDMNGYELCRRLRRQVGARPVMIALTGWGQPEDKKAAKDAGFDTHFTKPAETEMLCSALHTLLNARASAPGDHGPNLFITTTNADPGRIPYFPATRNTDAERPAPVEAPD